LEEREQRDLALIRMARAYGKHFNSPEGEAILRSMKEGEEFTLKFEDELLRVIKRDNRAVVEVLGIDGEDSLFRYSPT
ncbi:MAG: hypothetical protein ACE5H4_15555, partial [Candidatus Thorarchaeota archaeon]